MTCKHFSFGDTAVILNVADDHTIEVDGKSYHYDDNYFGGIMPCNKDGSERISPWPRKVWEAVWEAAAAKECDGGKSDA